MDNTLQKTSTLTPASFDVGIVKLTKSQLAILELINNSVENKKPITQEDINKAYLNTLYPNDDGKVMTKIWHYNSPDTYEMREFGSYWGHSIRPKQWFKNNLASCIIKGKLLVLPIIEID